MADRFYIGMYDADSGVQTNLKPFAIPDTAFASLTNAYVFRGRVRKRFGSLWLGDTQDLTRLRIHLDDTDPSGNFIGTIPLDALSAPIATPAVGQMFSISDVFFTVNALGTPANLLRSDGSMAGAVFDTTTGDVIISGAAADTAVYYYPALPVMGLLTFEETGDQRIIGFDTRFAYEYTNGWQRLDQEVNPGDAAWTGDNVDFFWGTTWTGTDAFTNIFFVTNFNPNEPNYMRYLLNDQWNTFRPQITGTDYLNSAGILVTFKNRLVAFDTWEGASLPGDNYINRARYSQVGSPLDANAWRQDIPGRGSAIDAPTTEAIITVEFIKDRLIVFFERSTYEFVYTGNQAYPFAWQKINTELGAESRFSIIPMDKVAIGVGNVGVHQCNGTNVDRIDQKIPSTVFEINQQNNGVERVYGIRDFFTEVLYWTYPNNQQPDDFPYPNRVLLYNYKNNTWAFNEDSITVFGRYLPQNGVTWDSDIVTWDDEITWDSSYLQGQVGQVIAGNQEGWTFIINADVPTNAPALQITDISYTANIVTITAIDHNLAVGDYVLLSDINGIFSLESEIFQIIDSGSNPITVNTFSFIYDLAAPLSGVYIGGGTIARVSNIVIATKQYNFYAQQGRNAFISKIDFMVDKTDNGSIQVEYYASTSPNNLLLDANSTTGTGALLGTGTLDTFPYDIYPYEANASRVWRSAFPPGIEGECIQLVLQMNDAQMRDPLVSGSDFELNSVVFYSQSTSRLQ